MIWVIIWPSLHLFITTTTIRKSSYWLKNTTYWYYISFYLRHDWKGRVTWELCSTHDQVFDVLQSHYQGKSLFISDMASSYGVWINGGWWIMIQFKRFFREFVVTYCYTHVWVTLFLNLNKSSTCVCWRTESYVDLVILASLLAE